MPHSSKKSSKPNKAARVLSSAGSVLFGDGGWVSLVSKWTDKKWLLDGRSVGAATGTVTCNWAFPLNDGSTLFDSKHERLLHEARHFIWSLYSDRREGRHLKTAGVGNIFHSLRRLLRWMVEHNYVSFAELNNLASSRFIDWLVNFYVAPATAEVDGYGNDHENDGPHEDFCNHSLEVRVPEVVRPAELDVDDGDEDPEETGVTSSTLGNALGVWRLLWQQRFAMSRLGVGAVSEIPFSGRSVNKISNELATKIVASIPALPDAVAIPLMNAAHKFITEAAEDLINLTHGIYQIRSTAPASDVVSQSEYTQLDKYLRGIRFSTPEGATRPWHAPLGFGELSAVQEARYLIDDLTDACTIIIQAETGMRCGEISSVLGGMDNATGLPSCIDVRTSKSGMLDLYYLRSRVTKLRPTPVDEQWLLAAAPRGTRELPDAVRAVVVLQELLEPLRALAVPDVGKYLLVTLGTPRGFPILRESVTEPSNQLIRLGQKKFARSFVDWDSVQLTTETRPYKTSQGDCIRTHQWRKTYARFVFQVDKRMLPAISRQFKHLSIAMTEDAYIGTSPSLIADVAEFNRDRTASTFLAKIRGTASKQEGRLARLMEQHLPELQRIVENMDDNEARGAIEAWCRSRDMKIFFHGYGQCIPAVEPTKAECHKRANTVHWANKAPNYEYREPSVCAGCYLFLAGEETGDYWTNRYIDNKVSWEQANAQGRGNEFRVARVRADQAKSYLVSLGLEIPEVEINDEG